MQGVRQFGNALILILLSIGLVLGGLSLSLVQFSKPSLPAPTDVLPPSPIPLTATATFPPPLESPTPTSTAIATNTPVPPASCAVPAAWIGITVQAGDTLDSLAARYRTTTEALRTGNCLFTNNVVVNSILYVPNVPVSTTVACIPGAVGWVRNYTVKAGDTFFHIAFQYYTDAATLKRVNCRTSDRINPGEVLWVPNRATRTPTPTPTLPPFAATFTPTPTETSTETVVPPTATPTATDTPPPATATPTFTPSATPFPSPTPTP